MYPHKNDLQIVILRVGNTKGSYQFLMSYLKRTQNSLIWQRRPFNVGVFSCVIVELWTFPFILKPVFQLSEDPEGQLNSQQCNISICLIHQVF